MVFGIRRDKNYLEGNRMTKVLVDCKPEISSANYDIICDRCGEKFRRHIGYNCRYISNGGKLAKFQEKESKMKYDKETVIGVIDQMIKRVGEHSVDGITLRSFRIQAQIGYYSTPTLEEVWKEKIDKLYIKDRIIAFTFDYEGKEYITSMISFLGKGQWSQPTENIKQ